MSLVRSKPYVLLLKDSDTYKLDVGVAARSGDSITHETFTDAASASSYSTLVIDLNQAGNDADDVELKSITVLPNKTETQIGKGVSVTVNRGSESDSMQVERNPNASTGTDPHDLPYIHLWYEYGNVPGTKDFGGQVYLYLEASGSISQISQPVKSRINGGETEYYQEVLLEVSGNRGSTLKKIDLTGLLEKTDDGDEIVEYQIFLQKYTDPKKKKIKSLNIQANIFIKGDI
ncbi:hypothetical protein [Pontibacter sp. G13]|uniref:hypothetical protein n=1 Tax=Pontibacter sp. G13 TaxID=3074898 RepID=UPI00288BB211|nr:hypothetical protein [Pontibacter sp. G13]WNJ20456.1 hypothetical protein RJD25_08240 [Pontibacter sp. G13]